MPTEGERIATLEEMAHNASKERGVLFDRQDKQDAALDAIQGDVHVIRQQIEKYRGFWGGIVLAISCLAAFLGMALSALKEKLIG